MAENASEAGLLAENTSIPLVGLAQPDAHNIVPIWTFALFLLAYLLVSATIRRRYRWRRQMIEAVLQEVELKRASGEEMHWPQPRPSSPRDEEGNPVTPPKDPGEGDGEPSRDKGGGKKTKGKKKKKKKKNGSKSPESRSGSPLERSLSGSGGDDDAQASLGTFEVEESPRDEPDGGGTAAAPGATFDVEDSPARTESNGRKSRGTQKRKASFKEKVGEQKSHDLGESRTESGSRATNQLVRHVTVMDMGPGAAPEDAESAAEIRSEIETEREKESRLPVTQRFIRHMSGNLEGLLLIQEFGVEAGFYLAVLWLFARFLLCMSFLGLPLAAFYYRWGESQMADLSCFTAANLAEGSPETGVTVAAACILLTASQACGVYVWSRLQRMKYSTKEAKKEALNGSTLMIDGLPTDITDDQKLADLLEILIPGWIKNAHVALDLEKLIHIERRLAAARHEHERAVKSMSSCSGASRVRKAEKLVDKLEREEEETRTTELKGTGIAFLTFRSLHRAMEFKRAISARQYPDATPSPVGGSSTDSFGADSVKVQDSTEQDVASSDLRDSQRSSPTKQQAAHPLAADAELLNLFGWKTEVAPNPSDILWENLRITSDSRKRRKSFSRVLLFSILLFGSTLVLLGVFFLGFHYVNLVYDIEPGAHVTEGLSQVGDGLAEVFGSLYWIVFLAPPAFFLFLIASVPVIAKKLLVIEKHFTRSAVMQSYVTKSFAFYLLLNLVLTSCSWVVIVTQSEDQDGRMSKMRILADLSGTFHICVVLTEAFIMAPLRLYRGWNLHAGIKCVAFQGIFWPTPAMPFNPTLNSDEMDDDAVLLFDFSKQYAEIFSILAMVLAYGPLLPFVLPAGWLYFEILLMTDQQVLRQQFAKHRTEDKRIRTITTHIQWAAVAALSVPFAFIAVHGTKAGVIVLSVLAFWMLLSYALYIDRADNHGKYLYNRLERCFPCMKTSKSARAQVGMTYTTSVDAGHRGMALDDVPSRFSRLSSSTDYLPDDRDFAQLSLARANDPEKQKKPKDSKDSSKDDEADASPSLSNVANPLAPDNVIQHAGDDPTTPGGREEDNGGGAETSPYSHPLGRALSSVDSGKPRDDPGLSPGPTTFDLDDAASSMRPTPLVLDGANGASSNGNGNGNGKKKKKKRIEGFSLRRKKVDMTPANPMDMSMDAAVEDEDDDEKDKPGGGAAEAPEAIIGQRMTEFKGKGSFPKRGGTLKPASSAEYAAASQKLESVNSAEAFHLQQAKLTDGLPIALPHRAAAAAASDSDGAKQAGGGGGGGDGMSFSAFDDMLATATVGGKGQKQNGAGGGIARTESDDL